MVPKVLPWAMEEVELTSKNFEQQNVITEGHLVAILTIKFNTPQIFSLNGNKKVI